MCAAAPHGHATSPSPSLLRLVCQTAFHLPIYATLDMLSVSVANALLGFASLGDPGLHLAKMGEWEGFFAARTGSGA